MAEKNLWGDTLTYETVRMPSIILKEQASILGTMTNQLLEGQVLIEKGNLSHVISLAEMYAKTASAATAIRSLKDYFVYRFDIVAPTLGPYRYTLFRIIQPIEIYPTIIVDEPQSDSLICRNEVEFTEALSLILTSERTKRVVTGLLSQVKAVE